MPTLADFITNFGQIEVWITIAIIAVIVGVREIENFKRFFKRN